MRINMGEIQVKVTKENVNTQQSDTILTDTEVISQIEQHFHQEIAAVYIMEDGNMNPILLVEWRYYLSETDQYELLMLDFTEEELSGLHDMGIL